MKPSIIFFVFTALHCICFGSGRKPAEANLVAKFAYELSALRKAGIISDLNSWEDVEALPEEAQTRLLGPPSGTPNISDTFVLIPRNKRFPIDGAILLLASAKPVNVTQWYRAQAASESASPEDKKALLEEYDRLNPTDKLYRWYIAIADNGQVFRNDIEEERFLSICLEHNFTMPPASPYRTNLSRQIDEYLLAKSRRADAKTGPTPPIDSTSQKPVQIHTPTSVPASPTKRPSIPFWLLTGVLVLALGVIFAAKRKK